jgi:hypothetical protein
MPLPWERDEPEDEIWREPDESWMRPSVPQEKSRVPDCSFAFDLIFQNGFRVLLKTNPRCAIDWYLLNAEPYPGLDVADDNAGPIPEMKPGYLARGTAVCFGAAVADMGDFIAQRWLDTWFAEMWSGYSESDKNEWRRPG